MAEERHEPKERKRKRKILFWVLIALLGLAVAGLTIAILMPKFRFFGFRFERKVEYEEIFEPQNGEVCYGNFLSCENLDMEVIGEVNTKELGEYDVEYVVRKDEKEVRRAVKVKVVDESAPELVLTEFENLPEGEEEKVSVCQNGVIPKIRMKAEDKHDGNLTEDIGMEFDGEFVTISVTDKSGNRAERKIRGVVEDLKPPVITLNGEESRTVSLNVNYEEEGATAKDNCDGEVKPSREGEVNLAAAGTYEIKYKARDEAGNESEAKRTVKVVDPASGNRIVYLTFDDGPGEYTGRLLDILAKYGVKVTFFVTGRGDDALIKREYDEGHTVALHSNTHNYAYIYANANSYFEDLYAIRDRVQRITGKAPTLIRFPGGSSNTVSTLYDNGARIMSYLTAEVGRRGFAYADWNVSSGDAGGATTADQVYWNVIGRLGEGQYVVLQHDIKGFSVDAVERIIQHGLANGYTFLPMNEYSFLAHHGVNN